MGNESAPRLPIRLLGIFIDQMLVFAYAMLLFGVAAGGMVFFGGGKLESGAINPWLGELIGVITLTLPVATYFIVAESGDLQASIGKRLVKIKVTDAAGNRASLRAVAIRTTVKLVPWEIAHLCIHHTISDAGVGRPANPLLMIGLITSNVLLLMSVSCVILRRDRRGLHDLVAGTKLHI